MSDNTNPDLKISNYSEKAVVVRGETRAHKEALKQMGGKWNSRLRDGAGWIFPKNCEARVTRYIMTGDITPDDFQQRRAAERNVRRTRGSSSGSNSSSTTESDVLKNIRQLFSRMSSDARLNFLRRVTLLASQDIVSTDSQPENKKSGSPIAQADVSGGEDGAVAPKKRFALGKKKPVKKPVKKPGKKPVKKPVSSSSDDDSDSDVDISTD